MRDTFDNGKDKKQFSSGDLWDTRQEGANGRGETFQVQVRLTVNFQVQGRMFVVLIAHVPPPPEKGHWSPELAEESSQHRQPPYKLNTMHKRVSLIRRHRLRRDESGLLA